MLLIIQRITAVGVGHLCQLGFERCFEFLKRFGFFIQQVHVDSFGVLGFISFASCSLGIDHPI